jgi:hypothetical protein
MNKVKAFGLSTTLLVTLNGCLLTSPYWNQEFDDHTEAISLQAFTGNKNVAVKFQCAKAYHGGLYPSAATASWVQVANITPQSQGLLDPSNNRVFGAGTYKALPATCWRFDSANSSWYAAVRATQNTTVLGTTQKYFHTFDKAGLECLGRETGKAANWIGWNGKGCVSNAYYAIIRATS